MRRLPLHRCLACSAPALLFVVALALRCYGLTAPLLDYHSWRQADTAAIARNFAANGYHLFYPQVDWGGLTPGYVESEFPLYAFSLALLFGVFGPHEWPGRLLTALVAAAAVVMLYVLALPTSGRRAASYAGIVFAGMPFALYFGRTVMPDSLMLLTATLALWSFRAWIERPSRRRLLLALLLGALAPLAKTPNLLIVAVPLAALVWAARPNRSHWSALVLYGACFTLPVLLWMRHARSLPADPRLSFGIGEKLFELRLLVDPQFYLLLARWSVENLTTPAGVPFLVLGLGAPLLGNRHGSVPGGVLAVRNAPMAAVPYAWLFGVLLFLLAGAAGVVGQDYYLLPLAGPLAWLIGVGIDRVQQMVQRRCDERIRRKGHQEAAASAVMNVHWLVPILSLAAIAGLGVARAAPLYRTADFYRTLGQRVDLALPPGARVGVIAPAVSEILYYGNRRGWRLDPGVIVPGGLSSLPPDLGVRYVLIGDPWLTERRATLTEALRAYRRIPVGPYALLLDLSQPGVQPPFELVWETGHLVEEPFLGAWLRYGGVAGLGFPLSDALDGPEGRIQYFERGLLVRGTAGATRAPAGRLLLLAQGDTPQSTMVAPQFREAWRQAGGAARLGDAISPVLSMSDGRQVQYFEYGALAAVPGEEPAEEAIGRRLLALRGLSEERQIRLAAARRDP